MRLCPNCGQDVAADTDRFCPHCGALLPSAPNAGNASTAQPAAASAQSPGYAPPPSQPAYQPPQASARPTYTYTAQAPDPNAYSAPAYTQGGVSGVNLPASRVQPPPRPGSNAWMNIVRSIVSADLKGMLIMAAVVLAVIVVLVIVFKIVAWFLSLWWLWLIIIAALAYSGSRRRRRGRRLP